jgi:beta-lactam-binding protein with PASTA domain
VGQRKDAAVKRLRDAGFRVGVYRAEKRKPGVPAGVIIDQEPSRGMRMCRRADISVVVST